MKRIVGIATMKGREESLIDAIRSLQNQVDEIHIFKNDERGDFAKFDAYFEDDFYFPCDDDLIYPNNYCDRMIAACEKYPESIITCHGRNFLPPINNFYNNGIKYHCLREVKKDIKVNIGGTGVMLLPPELDLPFMVTPNMADIHIALLAKEFEIDIICMAHEADWIKQNQKVDLNETIYAKAVNNCEEQTRLINTVKW